MQPSIGRGSPDINKALRIAPEYHKCDTCRAGIGGAPAMWLKCDAWLCVSCLADIDRQIREAGRN